MNPVWLIPLGAVLVGGAAVAALAKSAAEEARLLVQELGRQRDVADALHRLGDGLADLGGALPHR